MASHTVASGAVGAHHKTLTASTVDTVTFTDDIKDVEVVSNGSSALYFTTDGTAPTVGAATAHYLPASASVRTVRVLGSSGTVVKLISSGTPTYSVARAD